ncbi:MAG: NTP transferase domain-containing protein [Lachnospiraceae bacterium]|nr:NTP transferase domain-containing protein [Lachnospiraceae bacterium]
MKNKIAIKAEQLSKQESDILYELNREAFVNQRILAEKTGHSLGMVNKCINSLVAKEFLDDNTGLTPKALDLFKDNMPKNAVILAAGFGMRMVPINMTTPKALLEVYGEPLIERIIKQLHEIGVKDITVVVGFMKESFEYLIDDYGVDLVVNPDYASKNSLSSLALVTDRLGGTYIIPSDIWCDRNPFHAYELYSWYMVSDLVDNDSDVRVNRKNELVKVGKNEGGNAMVGITYLSNSDAPALAQRIRAMASDSRYDEDFWECALYKADKMIIPAKVVASSKFFEINTYEQLRDLDDESDHLKSDAIDVIADVFKTSTDTIEDICVLKKGMTNRSFLFSVNDDRYIMRIPGEGTDQLINRAEEAVVFKAISGKGLCDAPVYINPANGYKITKYLDGIRCCDPEDEEDIKKCMKRLKSFHEMHLSVPHTFDVFEKIDFYETLWNNRPSMYKDYQQTKANVFYLRSFIDGIKKDWCLTHIDAVPDNFLFYETDEGEAIQLTDWEYAGMQDPHVDIAMFCIYSLYNKEQIDRLIDIYFEGKVDRLTRAKIYAYIAMCGLLWSNWCEFKSHLGVEFGEYSLRQYRYAKEFYRYCQELCS